MTNQDRFKLSFGRLIMNFQPIFDGISGDNWQKVVKIVKNTEGVNKRTETDFKEIYTDIWQKVVKIGKNTEGSK